MSSTKLIKTIKDDEYSKQQLKCVGCRSSFAQFNDLSDDNIVELKDIQELGSPDPVLVPVCDNCKKQGKQNDAHELLYEKDGRVYSRQMINPIKRSEATKEGFPKVVPAVDANGKPVMRNNETGKVVDKNPDIDLEGTAVATTPGTLVRTGTTTTTTAKGRK